MTSADVKLGGGGKSRGLSNFFQNLMRIGADRKMNGNNSGNNIRESRHGARTRSRRLYLESLEERALLSVTSGAEIEAETALFAPMNTGAPMPTGNITSWSGLATAISSAQSGDTLTVSANLTANSQIQITKSLTIRFEENVTVTTTYNDTSVNTSAIFLINTADIEVNIEGSSSKTIFTNNNNSTGTVRVFRILQGTLSVDNINITNYKHYSGSGGAFYVTAPSSGEGGELNLSNSTINNVQTANNGAIYCDSVGRAKVICNNVTFTNNKSNSANNPRGGAIYAYTEVDLTDCVFTSNTAASGGGALNIATGTVTIQNSKFVQNTSTVNNGNYGGGAIQITGGMVKIQNTEICQNSSARFGGGIHQNGGTLLMDRVTIAGNYGAHGGGVTAGYTAASTLEISNSLILDNGSANAGGGILAYNNTTSKIYNCSVVGNTANNVGGIHYHDTTGAGKATLYNSVVVNNCSVDDNHNNNFGQGIGPATASNNKDGDNVNYFKSCITSTPTAKKTTTSTTYINWDLNPTNDLLIEKGSSTHKTDVTGLTTGNNITDVYGKVRVSGTNIDIGAAESIPTLTAPTGLAANAQDSSVSLTWNTVSNAQSYTVAYRAGSSGDFTEVNAGNETTYNVTGLTNGTQYEFKVMAVRTATPRDYYDSVYSGTVNATPTQAATPLDAPTNLQVSNVTKHDMTLTWNTVSNASSYTISWGKGDTATGGESVTELTTNTYDFSNLTAGTTYYFKVMAVGDGTTYSNSAYSEIQNATTLDLTQLATPTGLNATGISTVNITFNWTAVEHASSYTVSYKKTSESVWTTVACIAETSMTVTGLISSTEYQYKVQAIGDGIDYSNSAESDIATATTSYPVQEAPSRHVTIETDTVNSNDGEISLREALVTYKSVGNEVTFADNITNCALTSEILIEDTVTINGGDGTGVTITASDSRHFYVYKEAENITVTMNNLTLTGGKGTGTNLTDMNHKGGSICVARGELVVNNTKFYQNSVTNPGATDLMEILPYGGGAIYVGSANESLPATLKVNGCDFGGNIANNSTGGAIYLAANSNFYCYNSLIAGNKAVAGGGIMDVTSGTDVLYNTTIAGNYITGSYDTLGGGIYVGEYNEMFPSLYNCIVARNYSTAHASCWQITKYKNSSDEEQLRCNNFRSTIVFGANSELGPAFLNFSTDIGQNSWNDSLYQTLDCHLDTDDTESYQIVAINMGNNDYINSTSGTQIALTKDLDGNDRILVSTAGQTTATVDQGCYEYQFNINTVANFEDKIALALANAAGGAGSEHTTVKISSTTTLTNAQAISSDITIEGEGITPVTINAAESGARHFNVGQGSSGRVDAKLTLKNVTLAGGNTNKNGGAIAIAAGCEVVATDVSFTGNSTSANGGAICNYGTLTINITEGRESVNVFSNNSANGFGGAYFGCGSVTINGATFSGNTSVKTGGAIYSETKDNIFASGANVTLNNCTFTNNSVTGNNASTGLGNGGSIANWGTLTINDGSFTGSYDHESQEPQTLNAPLNGGAIFNGTGGNLTVNGVAFSNFYASYGGAIANAGTLTFLIDSSKTTKTATTFTGNIAENNGGAVANSGTLNFNGACSFTNNGAKYFGGAVISTGDNLNFASVDATIVFNGNMLSEGTTGFKKGTQFAVGNPNGDDTVTNMITVQSGEANQIYAYKYGTAQGNSGTVIPVADLGLADSSQVLADLDNDGVFEETSFLPTAGLAAGTNNVNIKLVGTDGSVTDTVAVLELIDFAPAVAVTASEFAGGKILKLEFDVYSNALMETWRINWGDGQTSEFTHYSNSLDATHFYAQGAAYDITLEVIDTTGAGAGNVYFVGTHVVPAAAPAALPVVPTDFVSEEKSVAPPVNTVAPVANSVPAPEAVDALFPLFDSDAEDDELDFVTPDFADPLPPVEDEEILLLDIF